MKKLILIVALFCSLSAIGQSYTYIAQRYDWLAGVFRALGLPAGSGPAAFQPGQRQQAGSVYYDSSGVDAGLYIYDGTTWVQQGATGFFSPDQTATGNTTHDGGGFNFTLDNTDGLTFNTGNTVINASNDILMDAAGRVYLEADDSIRFTSITGTLNIPNLIADDDTATFKPIGRSSGGQLRQLSYWPGSVGWNLTGNAGTDASTNFVGTTDDQPLYFRINNVLSGALNRSTGNTSWGYKALSYPLITGNRITAVGDSSLPINTSGNDNTSLGYHAGADQTTGSDVVYIGSESGGKVSESGNASNAIAIGKGVKAATNETVIGNSSTDSATIRGELKLPDLVSGVGTKSVRFDPSTGKLTYADTTTGGDANLLFDSLGTDGISPVTARNDTLYSRRISVTGGLSIDTTASGGLVIDASGVAGSPNAYTSVELVNDTTFRLVRDDLSADTVVISGGGGGGGGSAAWGDITGTLSDQTDLQSALDAKQVKDIGIIQSATYTLTSTTSTQKLFDVDRGSGPGVLPVDANTTYLFECIFSLTSMSATTGNCGFDIIGAGTATFTSVNWIGNTRDAVIGTAATASNIFSQTSAVTGNIAQGSTSTEMYAHIKGTIRVNAGGTIIPSINLTTAAAAVVGINSYFKLTPIGSGSVTSW